MRTLDIETLRRRLRRAYNRTGDAYIDIAYHAKVHPTTVGNFLRGDTRHPTFLTRWGLRQYLESVNQKYG